ncbi:MAG: hypothetical protein JWL95_1685 [Gemmatimonadetes bacterium]|nr:hypothetical protein [Gemmatimonadota bacterium]
MAHTTGMGQPTNDGSARATFSARRSALRLVAAVTLLVIAPWPLQAQFGMLKKLKNAVSAPDSSARAKDSLTQISNGVLPDSVKIGKGLLARGVAAGKSASDKMEAATGISAKDAALAATGVGAGNLLAKKMGVDPMSLGKAAMENAKAKGQQKAMQAATGATGLSGLGGLGTTAKGMAGMSGMPSAAQLQQMQSAIAQAGAARAKSGAAANAGAIMGAGLAGFTQADAEALVAFQQEMMQVAMAASAGDASAKARLDAWQALTLKHEGEIQKLSIAAQAGDMAAVQKLQLMQFTIMQEWAHTAGTKAKVMKAIRP